LEKKPDGLPANGTFDGESRGMRRVIQETAWPVKASTMKGGQGEKMEKAGKASWGGKPNSGP